MEKKKRWPLWVTIVVIILWLIGLTFWGYYEMTQMESREKKLKLIAENIAKADKPCECEKPKPKAKVTRKKAKAKPKTTLAKKLPEVQKAQPVDKIAIVSNALQDCNSFGGTLILREGKVICDIKKAETAPKQEVAVLTKAKEDFYDKAVMPQTWVTEPEKEVAPEPPKVGRKIIVIREQQTPYYGGYSSGYYPSYAPQVTYGQPYVPPPQTVFVPAPPVFVPAPSVVTPAGGYAPRGTTDGRSPSGVSGSAL